MHLSPIGATDPTHLIILDLITRIFGEQYGSVSSSFCSYLHSPVTSSLLDPNIYFSTLFSNTLSICAALNMTDQVSHPTLKFYTRVLSIWDSKRLLAHVDISRLHTTCVQSDLTVRHLRLSQRYSWGGPFSWYMTLSQWVTGSRRFEATYCSQLQGSKCPLWRILDIMAREAENTKLTRNVGNQLPSDVPSYPRRTANLRLLIRKRTKQNRQVNARSRKVDH
jgi:hypothetical protein